MAQSIILKRSALQGKVPTTSSLSLGEIAINTYDGKLYLNRSGSIQSIQEVVTTNVVNTGSITLTQTGSFAELVVSQDGNFKRDLYVTRDIITNGHLDILYDVTASAFLGAVRATNGVISSSVQLTALNSFTSSAGIRLTNLETTSASVNSSITNINAFTASENTKAATLGNLTGSYATTGSNSFKADQQITGSLGVSGDITVLGSVNARQFNIGIISSSILYTSGSTKFGDTQDDTMSVTGSLRVSGSTTITGSLSVTSLTTIATSFTTNSSSFLLTSGSNLIIQNSGLAEITGSLRVSGSQTITGSFLVSGSTTQVGNNTLQGNTVLSGSLTVSGSQGTYPYNINIYGDTSYNGNIQLLPVSANINNAVSASYIYVSGSTQDLYFTQNGAGFQNTTRLRWLEGNVYTGLLGGGIISQSSSTTYTIGSGSGLIVNYNASTASIEPYPTFQYVKWGLLTGSITSLSASFDQSFIGISNSGSIIAQGLPFSGSQTDTIINIGLVLHQNRSTINGVKTQPYVAYGLGKKTNTFITAFGPLKVSGLQLLPSGSSTGGLVVSSGTAFTIGSNYTLDPNNTSLVTDSGTNVSKIFKYKQTGSSWVYDTNGGVGYSTIDPTQYSNNGVLTTVSGNNPNQYQWTIQRCYWFPNSVTKAIVVYYGNAQYTTQDLAIGGLSTEVFTEAPNTLYNAVYLGAFILRKDANFTDNTTYSFVNAGLFRSSGQGGANSSITSTVQLGLTSLNTYTSSVSDPKFVSIGASTASLNQFTASINAWSGSLATTGSNSFNGNQTITGSLNVTGTITANEFHTTFVSSSVLYTSGSTKFGDTGDDIMQVTGSLKISGSQTVTGSISLNGGAGFGVIGAVDIRTAGSSGLTVNGEVNIANGAYTDPYGGVAYDLKMGGNGNAIATRGRVSFDNGKVQTDGSGNLIVTGSLRISGSQTITGSVTATSFTGSLFGTASFALNGSSNAIMYQTASAASTWVFNHFLATPYPVVTVYDNNNSVIIPQSIVSNDSSSLTITFSSARTGVAVASKGGYVGSSVGTATVANALTTARLINGTSFDGTQNITIPNLVSGSTQINLAGTSDYSGLFGGIGASTSSINAFTSSHNSWSGSVATTGSNIFGGNQTITGSVSITGSLNSSYINIGTSSTTANKNNRINGTVLFDVGSTITDAINSVGAPNDFIFNPAASNGGILISYSTGTSFSGAAGLGLSPSTITFNGGGGGNLATITRSAGSIIFDGNHPTTGNLQFRTAGVEK
jgi:hypothetical protein